MRLRGLLDIVQTRIVASSSSRIRQERIDNVSGLAGTPYTANMRRASPLPNSAAAFRVVRVLSSSHSRAVPSPVWSWSRIVHDARAWSVVLGYVRQQRQASKFSRRSLRLVVIMERKRMSMRKRKRMTESW